MSVELSPIHLLIQDLFYIATKICPNIQKTEKEKEYCTRLFN